MFTPFFMGFQHVSTIDGAGAAEAIAAAGKARANGQ